MLQSVKQLYGDKLGASDGEIGRAKDFYFDDRNWAVRQLVIKTGHRFSGNAVQIPTRQFDLISYDKSTVFVHLTGKAVELCPPLLVPVVAAD